MTSDPYALFLSNALDWLARATRGFMQARLRCEIAHLDDRLMADVGLQRIGNRIERRKPTPGSKDGD